MRQVFRRIPVYTGDVSGVCSALYELGGMVVMHDPSGCNSTYNTHDEIRWYDRDSLIFLSGLDEMDAIMGNDEKLIRDIEEAAAIYHPAFIAIVNSPIPYITGMDFDAICRIVEKDTGIPSFYTMTNGMHDYVHGAGLAFRHLAERFVSGSGKKAAGAGIRPGERSGKAIRCNLIGLTPLDFAAPSTLESLRTKILGAGMEIRSSWAMGKPGNVPDPAETGKGPAETGKGPAEAGPSEAPQKLKTEDPFSAETLLQGVRDSTLADVSLVLSSTGLPAAEYLREKYGIPYVAGIPAAGTERLYFDAVRTAVRTGKSQFPFRERTEKEMEETRSSSCQGNGEDARTCVCLIGEPAIMTSLAASVQRGTGAATHVFGATEGGEAFLGPQDAALRGEEELFNALQEISGRYERVRVIADPCYAPVLPQGCELVRLPQLAFSGRIFLKEIPDLIQTVFL